jgi:predicted O-methyltransferase YrrM
VGCAGREEITVGSTGFGGPDKAGREELRAAAKGVDTRGFAGGADLARALRVASRAKPDRPALGWFERIEGERRQLLRDDRELSGGRGTTSTVRSVTRRASVPTAQAWLLYTLVRRLGARRCLEMGTCVGISGAYLAAAMTTLGGGTLRSLEGHRDRAAVASETWRRLGFADAEVVVGRFERTLQATLDTGPFDLVFVDGDHDGDATRSYVERIRAVSRPGALLVLDDIAWSDGMAAAWHDVSRGLAGSISVDLGRVGLVLLGPDDAGAR